MLTIDLLSLKISDIRFVLTQLLKINIKLKSFQTLFTDVVDVK